MGSNFKKRKKIRLFAFDFDGTILEEELISKEVERFFKEFVEKGGVIAAATGRPMEGVGNISEILRNSGITPNSEYPQFLISSDKFIYFLENEKYRPSVEWNKAIYKRWYRLLPQILKRLPECEDELIRLGFQFRRELPTLKEQKYRGFIAFSFLNIKTAEKALEIFKERLSIIDGISFGRNGSIAGMSCLGTGKGESLNKVREKIGVFPQEVLTVGDSQNDISMLDGRYGFHCATVSNAEDVIKEIVRKRNGYIASKPLGEGICEIMRKVVLID